MDLGRKSADPHKNWWIYGLPSFILIALIFLFPISYAVYISTLQWRIGGPGIRFIGLGNYLLLFTDNLFWQSLRVTLIYAICVVGLTVLLSLILALALNEELKGIGIFKAIMLIPWATSPLISGVIWSWLFNKDFGVVNYVLFSFGLTKSGINFLASDLAFPVVILATLWNYVPISSLILLAGIKTIPQELFEASKVDGANAWQSFYMITFPLLRNYLLLVVTFVTMWSLRAFDIIYSLTSGGPGYLTTVISWLIYQTSFVRLNFGEGSAISVILALITLVLTFTYFRLLYKRVEF